MNVISETDKVGKGSDPAPPPSRQTHEQRPAPVVSALPSVLGVFGINGLAILLYVVSIAGHSASAGVWATILIVIGSAGWGGFFVVQPNESRVLILFGRYIGSVTEPGLWWCNPFVKRRTVSLRVRNFQSERIKVNDASGNPIEIAAVVAWRVVDTAKAVFDVVSYEQFVIVQSETSLRHLASEYPYDDYKQDVISLRGNAEEIRNSLQAELQSRLELAGIQILEARLTHLAYAAEIAEVMLRRQQAEAIVAARQTMVQGAVSLVQMALAQLADSDLVELDPERKATMVSNLMVVLSGDHTPTAVINTGNLNT